MRFQRRRLEVRVVKDEEPTKTIKMINITPGHILVGVEQGSKIALRLYATKKAIDFAAHAAEHLLVTKIR